MGRLLDRINVLVIPQTNPYGNYFDVRANESGLDLNRDHVKIESEEVKAVHAVFRAWLPEVTLDVHEKGDDYYRLSIGCVSNANIDLRLQDYSRNRLLASVEKSLAKDGVTFHEYLVTEEMGVNTSAGAALRPEDTSGREEMTRFSTTDLNDGRNSLGIFQTLSFIQEGASRHDPPSPAPFLSRACSSPSPSTASSATGPISSSPKPETSSISFGWPAPRT